MPAAIPVIRNAVTASRARLLWALLSAKSVKGAAFIIGMHTERIARYVRDSNDQEIRKAYRACVDRGKRKRGLPKWVVMWADPRTPGGPVQIWTVRADTREQAFDHAVRKTGREPSTLTIQEAT